MTDPHPELDVWVDGIRARSEEAFGAVHRLLADELASFAYGMLGDRRTAEDVVQLAFVELVTAAPELRGDGRSLRSWLYRSVRFGCLDEMRRRTRHPENPAAELPESTAAIDPLDDLDPDLAAALNQLSDRQRQMIILRHVVGLDGKEIAAVMGTNRTAVYAALGRAERRLRSLLGEPADPVESSPGDTP